MFPARGENVKLGKGSLMLDLNDDDGNPTGLEFLGNASSISITSDITKAELYSSTQAAGGLVASNRTRLGYSVSAVLNEFTAENLKMWLLATENTVDQAAATDGALALAGVQLGRYYELGARNISGEALMVGTTALVEDTDYTINRDLGIVYLLPTAENVADDGDIAATWEQAATTITQLRIGTRGSQIARLVYLADDANTDGVGAKDKLEIWRVDVAPDGELNLISDDYGAFTLSMAVLSDGTNHPNDPYGVL